MLLLPLQSARGQRSFEYAIMMLLAVIAVGFVSGLFVNPPDAGDVFSGLLPRFEGTDTVLLAASMLGATVMPHAIYLHSSLARDRHGFSEDPAVRTRLIRATRFDVAGALMLAGVVNIAMLLLAASGLRGIEGTDAIAGAHSAVTSALGPVIGVVFAIVLLASGLASTSVGCYAGATREQRSWADCSRSRFRCSSAGSSH
ncbi:NRAMP (natural resistance-associated macrophage protein)-like metal ion transporter [Arthrobacter sp. UYNi723]